jgi:adenine-specific DNA-methyltransferase
MDYEQLPRAALIRLLQEHDSALADAGKNGIVMSYTGRAAPWHIIRQVKPKLSRILKKYSAGDEQAQTVNEIWDGEKLPQNIGVLSSLGSI